MDEMKAKRLSAELQNPRGNRKVYSRTKNQVKIVKPERFLANARMRKNHSNRFRRVNKKGMQKRASNKKITDTKEIIHDNDEEEEVEVVKYSGNSVGSPYVFVIRIRDAVGSPFCISKTLEKLRLSKVDEGIFVKYTEENRKLLHLVEPFVLYGVPSKETVTDLIVRRGHAQIDGNRTPLSDNITIEKALGDDTGIICKEDLVHEITSAGESFDVVATFLSPFHFTAPKSKFQKDILGEKSTNVYGDKGELIDDFIRQVL